MGRTSDPMGQMREIGFLNFQNSLVDFVCLVFSSHVKNFFSIFFVKLQNFIAFTGLMPRKVKLYLETHPEYEFTMGKFLSVEKQKNVHSLLKDYFSSIVKKWMKDFKELKNVEKTNYKILMTKGEVHVERKQKLESLSAAFKKLQSHVEQLSDILDEDLPALVDEDENAKSGAEGILYQYRIYHISCLFTLYVIDHLSSN